MPQTEQLWLELPPMSDQAPKRLIVFLHGAGSSPEVFAPVAIAWQLKFPGATAVLLQGLEPSPTEEGFDWFDQRGDVDARTAQLQVALDTLASRIELLQTNAGIDATQTIVVGFSQGATVALELARSQPQLASIVVAYAGRLASPVRPQEQISAVIHLIHGELDTLVPVVYARQAHRGLSAVGATVSLDIIEDGTHSIGQDMVIVGTTRAMQSVFKGRKPPGARKDRTLH